MSVKNTVTGIRYLSSLSASITRAHRNIYSRTYPTVIVNSDGSTFNIRYQEPRKIIKLPLDVWTLSEAERKAKIESRKPKVAVKIQEELEDDFNANDYLKFMKK